MNNFKFKYSALSNLKFKSFKIEFQIEYLNIYAIFNDLLIVFALN